MLIRTINWPVLVKTALCSIAHSSVALRLVLLHRAIQPGGGGADAAAPSLVAAEGGGAACAAAGPFLALGAWAWPWPHTPNMATAAIANLIEIFTKSTP